MHSLFMVGPGIQVFTHVADLTLSFQVWAMKYVIIGKILAMVEI